MWQEDEWNAKKYGMHRKHSYMVTKLKHLKGCFSM